MCALDGDVSARLLGDDTSLGGGTLPGGEAGKMPGEGVIPGVGEGVSREKADRCGVPTIESGISFGGEDSGCDDAFFASFFISGCGSCGTFCCD